MNAIAIATLAFGLLTPVTAAVSADNTGTPEISYIVISGATGSLSGVTF